MPDGTHGKAPAAADSDTAPMMPRRRLRGLIRVLLLLAVPLLAVGGGAYWYATTGRYVTSDNAYVKSRIIAVSSDIDGRVVAVHAAENEPVKAGDLLVELDAEPHRIALREAEARLLAIRNEVERQRAEYRQIDAEIAEARETVKFYGGELDRNRKLASAGHVAQSRLDETEFRFAAAERAIRVLERKREMVLTGLGGDLAMPAESYPAYVQVAAERDLAAFRLNQTVITAPADGIATRVNLEPGEWIEEGKAAFGLIGAGELWIETNLKETQLNHVRVGQPVDVRVDAYPDHRWKAQVASISPATGSEFSVLPAQNASGNWVKVVQRLPVRLSIEPAPGNPTLRAGMTATVEIDIGRERTVLADARRKFGPWLNGALGIDVFAFLMPAAN